jgi:hypothetical protein
LAENAASVFGGDLWLLVDALCRIRAVKCSPACSERMLSPS